MTIELPVAFLWRFRVNPAHRAEFERIYGPRGAWAELFARSDGYLGTELLREVDGAHYVTVDRWRARGDFAAFKERFTEEYAKLDVSCESLTESETSLGSYVVVS